MSQLWQLIATIITQKVQERKITHEVLWYLTLSCTTAYFKVDSTSIKYVAQAVVRNSGMKTTRTRFSNLNTIQLEKNRKRIPTKLINIVWLIKAIELSGVQFGLKWYAWFQNECTARFWFKVTSMILDQNCTKGSSITTLLHPYWSCRIELLKYRILKSVLVFQVIDPVLSWFKYI